MTQILESISMGTFGDTEVKCPFKDEDGDDSVRAAPNEDIEKDDRDAVVKAQANDGGKLGGNLDAGRHSADTDTFNDIPSAAPAWTETDAWRGRTCLAVPFTGHFSSPGTQLTFEQMMQPYHSSAHHVIPGNASLYASPLFKRYMEKGGKPTVVDDSGETSGSWEIEYHIGYNVNGSHNGVWLPNNYAIQQKGTPTGTKWSEYTGKAPNSDERKWIVAYIATASRWKGRQFHDAHTLYNTNVKGLMNKLCTALMAHQTLCKECQEKKGKKIPPPYKLKLRLYAISRVLRTFLEGHYVSWHANFLTSDQFRSIKGNAAEWAWFQAVYERARSQS